MKRCIIQLREVPQAIVSATCGDIDKGMFLTADAVKTLLRGEMFSRLQCYWSHAGSVSPSDALSACRHLATYNIVACIIYLK